jgi:hypothetical protein
MNEPRDPAQEEEERRALAEALRWQLDMGADEALEDEAQDHYAVSEVQRREKVTQANLANAAQPQKTPAAQTPVSCSRTRPPSLKRARRQPPPRTSQPCTPPSRPSRAAP